MPLLILWDEAGVSGPSPSVPDAEVVRRTAEEVLGRSYYQLGQAADVSHAWSRELRELFYALLRPFVALLESLHELSPVLAWLVTVFLIVSLILLIWHIAATLANSYRRNRNAQALLQPLARKKVDPVELARRAAEAELRGDHILGVRLLYCASLAQIERLEGKTFRPGATNREHLYRYRSTPLYDWLTRFVLVIDNKWYGYEPCVAADFTACREAYDQVCLLAERSANAQRA